MLKRKIKVKHILILLMMICYKRKRFYILKFQWIKKDNLNATVRNNKNEYVYVTSIFIFCFFECPSETPSLETPVARRIFNMMMLLFIISLSPFFLWLRSHYSTRSSEQSSILLDTFLILRILKIRNNFNKK